MIYILQSEGSDPLAFTTFNKAYDWMIAELCNDNPKRVQVVSSTPAKYEVFDDKEDLLFVVHIQECEIES
jgi:hypothetical protein